MALRAPPEDCTTPHPDGCRRLDLSLRERWRASSAGASGLLHHRDRSVTENYNLASSFEAAQRFAHILEAMI
jgi:hypothetical protein